MRESLVSILIPFKNTVEFLTECLDSIITQDYRNWEVIAVNDHSKDGSMHIVERFSLQDQRIKVYENPGSGIIEALRFAYSKSVGHLITRMDSDDIMTPEKLMVLVHNLRKSGKGHLAVGQVKYFSESGISNGYARYEEWLNQLTSKGANYSEIYKECVIPSPCWMAHREDFDLCGAFEPNRYPEDYDLAYRFRKAGLQCIPCNRLLHYWRDYDTRTSRTNAHYAENYFLDIKLYYFIQDDLNKERPLVVWGAGHKGKTIVKRLRDFQIDFTWVCDNPNKIGKSIYGKEMKPYHYLAKLNNPQSIIAVANEEAQIAIRAYFGKLRQEPMIDYFFFC